MGDPIFEELAFQHVLQLLIFSPSLAQVTGT
jgi:hypothetical protein